MKKMNIIKNICNIPIALQQRDDISVYELFCKSNYLESPNNINESSIKEYIEKHLELIPFWGLYSQNQRCTPAWYLELKSSGFFKKAEVGYINSSGKLEKIYKFRHNNEACAFFIMRQIETMAQI